MKLLYLSVTASMIFILVSFGYASELHQIQDQLELCKRSMDWVQCVTQIETNQISLAGNNVSRKGQSLQIQTQSQVVTFENPAIPGDGLKRCIYLGKVDAIGYHLVLRQFMENTDYVLIADSSGMKTEISEFPHLSQDNTKIAVVCANEMSGPIEVAVFSIRAETLQNEFHYKPKDYILHKFISWEGDNAIRLEKYAKSDRDLCPKSNFMTINEMLKLQDGKWTFFKASPLNVKCN